MADDQLKIEDCAFGVDGDMLMCMPPGFYCLSQDPAGFGATEQEAFEDLLEQWHK